MSSRYGQIQSIERVIEDGSDVVDIICDMGGGDLVTAEYMPPPGDDSLPCVGDFLALHEIEGEKNWQAIGANDPINLGLAKPGEVRHYARNVQGQPVAHIYQKNDGSIVVESLIPGASITVHSTGTLNLTSDTNDIRLGQGGRKIACVGDIVVGAMAGANSGGPVLPATLTAINAVPVVARIVSGLAGSSGG